jgi:hypothetical protein
MHILVVPVERNGHSGMLPSPPRTGKPCCPFPRIFSRLSDAQPSFHPPHPVPFRIFFR